jgi:phosphoglycerate dehydrogenase-like enzyme
MPGDLVWADAHRFPPSETDIRRVEAAGLRLRQVDGHEPAQFATVGADGQGLIAWGGRYDAAVFDALPALRVLARCGAGYDNIDLPAAALRGIITTYVPGGSDDEVAEHTLALLLAAVRRVPSSDRAVRDGSWPSSADLAPMIRLRGSRLGLVGFGRIARAVAWRAQALGVDVWAVDPFQPDDIFTAAGVRRCGDLDELLAGSHFVSLHVPATADHRPLIAAREFALFPPGAVLINTARGSLVQTAALVDALSSGHLGGAALDVVDPEPLPPTHPLLGLDNLIVTPHSAAFSVPALATIRERALDNALAVLRGAAPLTPIPTPDSAKD